MMYVKLTCTVNISQLDIHVYGTSKVFKYSMQLSLHNITHIELYVSNSCMQGNTDLYIQGIFGELIDGTLQDKLGLFRYLVSMLKWTFTCKFVCPGSALKDRGKSQPQWHLRLDKESCLMQTKADSKIVQLDLLGVAMVFSFPSSHIFKSVS